MHMLLVSFESGGNNIRDEKTAFLLLADLSPFRVSYPEAAVQRCS